MLPVGRNKRLLCLQCLFNRLRLPAESSKFTADGEDPLAVPCEAGVVLNNKDVTEQSPPDEMQP